MPGATRMCESPGGWSGLELTDTLARDRVCPHLHEWVFKAFCFQSSENITKLCFHGFYTNYNHIVFSESFG